MIKKEIMDSVRKQSDLSRDEDNSLLQETYEVRKCGLVDTIPPKH